MLSDKANARYLAELAVQHGVEEAVVCHGSRNAPLILSLNHQEGIRAHPLADERVAAFYALGMAQRSGKPTIVTCSSGTAALNMAPAAAEAYYQRIPLVLVTADRPDEWIDQMDGQTIRQERVFEPHVRSSVQLPLEPQDPDRLWYAERSINQALNASLHPVPGPVHINIPFREPLYERANGEEASPSAFRSMELSSELTDEGSLELKREWEAAGKIMLLAGSDDPDDDRDERLELLIREKGCTVLSESLSNLRVPSALSHIDRTLNAIPSSESSSYAPDLLITTGGAVVSKKIKAFLRQYPPKWHWRVDPSGEAIDTYRSLTRVIALRPHQLFEKLLTWGSSNERKAFRDRWQERASEAEERYRAHLSELPWSDLKAFEGIHRKLPEGSELHAGNSSPVRYLQLIERRPDLLHRGNRGTSGIDGVISTAAGAAHRTDRYVTVITGDIGFFYDSNALWNPYLPKNLRIILINNGGGGIFRIIEGPSGTEELDEFFEGVHELNARGISESFALPYYFCEDPEGLEEGLDRLYEEDRASVLEVRTPRETNDRVLREHFQNLRP
jgi:2-succinyl-5-enolpyruvyl-6-hydroxy-3-cyclohexene-1-carboxylate synthase